ncbi:hypothetical protein Tco_1142476 [Tanacetum coccineum]
MDNSLRVLNEIILLFVNSLDVFPDELPGTSSTIEIEIWGIELIPVLNHLEGSDHPVCPPWGAPVLFVKKKDEEHALVY